VQIFICSVKKLYIESFFLMLNVLKRIQKEIFKRAIFANGEKIFIAMSGGQDSIACLFFTFLIKNQLKLEMGFSNCNHLFQTDSFYCYVNNLNQVYALEGKFVITLSPYWLSTEKEARDWRYSAIQRIACFYNFSSLSFGHTQTDRLETFLFQLLRGSGVEGIHSLQWKQKRNSFCFNKLGKKILFTRFSSFQKRKSCEKKRRKTKNTDGASDALFYSRPLLGITRLETCMICKSCKIPSYSDSSNQSFLYTRNKVRNIVLPLLRAIINPRLEKTVCQFAEILSEESFHLIHILERFSLCSIENLYLFIEIPVKPNFSLILEDFQTDKNVLFLFSEFLVKFIQGTDSFGQYLLPQPIFDWNKPKNLHKELKFFDAYFLEKREISLEFFSFLFLKKAPLALKRRFLKKLLRIFQIKEINFLKIEIIRNDLFNKRRNFYLNWSFPPVLTSFTFFPIRSSELPFQFCPTPLLTTPFFSLPAKLERPWNDFLSVREKRCLIRPLLHGAFQQSWKKNEFFYDLFEKPPNSFQTIINPFPKRSKNLTNHLVSKSPKTFSLVKKELKRFQPESAKWIQRKNISFEKDFFFFRGFFYRKNEPIPLISQNSLHVFVTDSANDLKNTMSCLSIFFVPGVGIYIF
jgi:tRNA(Ile)-lysidine synthase TilS/MesJ